MWKRLDKIMEWVAILVIGIPSAILVLALFIEIIVYIINLGGII